MYSPELGNFQALRTNSNWNQMQNWQGMHTEKSSNSPPRGISSGNQEFGASRNSRTRQRSNWMGKQFHHSGEESRPTSWTRPFIMDKAKDLLGQKRPERGTGVCSCTTLGAPKRCSTSSTWHDTFHHCRIQQRILDGGGVHPESRKLTMMALDIGLFQWTCLPIGYMSWRRMCSRENSTQSFSTCARSHQAFADDMIIYGKTDKEHDETSTQLPGSISEEQPNV